MTFRAPPCVTKFYVVLQSISRKFELNIKEFNNYIKGTAKLVGKEYAMFHITANVHKILVQGADIVAGAILPIGKLSKVAQESRNKYIKYFRRSRSRKISRSSKIEDVFNVLLVFSGPLTSSLRKLPKTAIKTYFPEAIRIFSPPKEWEDLSSSEATATEDDSDDTGEEISNEIKNF